MTRLTLIEQLVPRTATVSLTTNSPVTFRGKGDSDLKPNVYSGEKGGETFTVLSMELQSWAGAMHDNMLKVLKLAHD